MGGHTISGSVKPGFEEAQEAFVENFERRKELGAACCVYHRGEKVVDLWGGIRNKSTGEPWEEDTMVLVFSATKDAFGHPSSFGAPGAGGSFGLADPHAKIGYAYVMNQMGAHLIDPRDEALRKAMYSSIGETYPSMR